MNRGMCPVPRNRSIEIDDLLVIHAAHHHAIEFDALESGRFGRCDTGEYLAHFAAPAAQFAERLRIERVERHRQSMQTGIFQRLREPRQQRAIRCQRDVFDPVDAGKHAHQLRQIAAQQRLATGEPQLAHAELREDTRNARDLFKAQALVLFQEYVILRVVIFRHAVRAAEVAAINDGDAQIVQRALQRIARLDQRMREREARHAGAFSMVSCGSSNASPARATR